MILSSCIKGLKGGNLGCYGSLVSWSLQASRLFPATILPHWGMTIVRKVQDHSIWIPECKRKEGQKGYISCFLRKFPHSCHSIVSLHLIGQNLDTWHFAARKSGICSLYSEWPYAKLKFVTMAKGKMNYCGDQIAVCASEAFLPKKGEGVTSHFSISILQIVPCANKQTIVYSVFP